MSPRAHRSTLLLLATALAATVLVALGLPRLRLSPGMPLPSLDERGGLASSPGDPSLERMTTGQALLWILAAGVALLLAHALWRSLRGVRLWKVLGAVVRGTLLIAAVCVAVVAVVSLAPAGVAPPAPPLPPPPPPAPRAPLGEPPSLLLWLIAAGLALASAALAAWLLRPRPPERDPLLLLGLEAERARADLLAGVDARNVILSCYARMSAVLAEVRGIDRPRAMTAREFCDRLASLGVPAAPVRDLTRLFEAVRYGAVHAGPGDDARALDCLGAIVEHCRTSRRAP